MLDGHQVIDSDGHVLEPEDLWLNYIDPQFRDRAPRLVVDADGKERLDVDGSMSGGKDGLGRAGSAEARTGKSSADVQYSEGRKGGFDPHARIVDLDLDGIDKVFLYPSLGLRAVGVPDPALGAAVSRAYNRWITEWCSPYPERLFGVGMLPMQDIDLAVAELEHVAELGLRAAFVRPNRYNNLMLGNSAYDRLWAVAQDRDITIGIHEGTGGMASAVGDRFKGNLGAEHIASHTIEMMLASLSLIWDGACERFPNVRFAFLEASGGWMAPWIDRMERHFDDPEFRKYSSLKLRPLEYFKRQCFVSFEPVESSIGYAAEYLGADSLLWASDYPHPDGFFPGGPAMVLERTPESARPGVLAGGAMRCYGLA
jgi:uncharacterized protein